MADFAPQPVITKDNVTMQIDTVIYFQITDPKLYTYGVEHPMNAIENLTATTLRNIIGEMELDQSLTSRDTINSKMRAILDEATDPWGIKVNRVELKNIIPPKEIQNAMEKQMKAERERRESILQAEGQKQSQILVAEGEKQSAILRADAAKQAAILKAEGEKEARDHGGRGGGPGHYEGPAGHGGCLKLLNAAAPNDQVVKLKALEAMQKVADGKATKIIIPRGSPIRRSPGSAHKTPQAPLHPLMNLEKVFHDPIQHRPVWGLLFTAILPINRRLKIVRKIEHLSIAEHRRRWYSGDRSQEGALPCRSTRLSAPGGRHWG